MTTATRHAADPTASEATPVGDRLLGLVLGVGGVVGLLAAFVLVVERIELLEDPSHIPSCSISPVLSCGSVMTTPQAEVFGFPNPLLGIAGFTALTVVAVVLLTGTALPRWFWQGLQAGVTFGLLFVHWLVYQSLYRIDALCPYCVAVWIVTIPVFWYTTLYNLTRGHLGTLGRPGPARTLAEYHGVVLTCWYLTIALLVLQRFWSYWTTLV
ncbi:vitamin K epoxide reductase family protein [Streptomyces hainanensis]|uniref:Vitamin K epoxide reductase family protein n=1 Tax=Streptomyces hainanensis TaxID=402648 RepID=A0A4R4SKR3_9ACTN|nr:vitamin K epoxide reductase family protein [Streptomyces hainanensis]TDC62632.1 vitamin K epoxide reductase family protein [Streptomyces hainanensis]